MSKEESERASAAGHASLVPPRAPASDPPRNVDSVPPVTDEIDTDWGAADDMDDEVTRVVQSPLSAPPPAPVSSASEPSPAPLEPPALAPTPIVSEAPAPAALSEAPAPAALSEAPALAALSDASAPAALISDASAPAALSEAAASDVSEAATSAPVTDSAGATESSAAVPVRPARPRLQTLIGMAPLTTDGGSPTAGSAHQTDSAARDAVEPLPARTPSAPPAPAHSRTLIGVPLIPQDAPPAEATSASATPLAGSVPPPSAQAQTVRTSRPPPAPARIPSVPPPRARISSVPPPLPSAALASPSPLPAPRAVSTTPDARAKSLPVESPVGKPAAVAESGTGFGRWVAVLGIAVVLVALISYRVLARDPAPPPPITAGAAPEPNTAPSPVTPAPGTPEQGPLTADAPSASAAPLAVPALAPSAERAASDSPTAPADPSATATASAAPSPSGGSAAPTTSAAPTASAAPTPTASADAPVAGASRSVTFKSSPPKARFFHFGKEVGTAPFTLQFKPGERHSYEVGLPGYITRKVTVDGSKPEITVGLRKEAR